MLRIRRDKRNGCNTAGSDGAGRVPADHRRSGTGRPVWVPLVCGLAILPLAVAASGGSPTSQAAGVNPLPAVAKALNGVTSYQAISTSTSSGTRPRFNGARPTGTPPPNARRGQNRGLFGLGLGFGPQTRTIVAVRKSGTFEDFVVIKGTDRSGKPAMADVIAYGSKLCVRGPGASSYSCQTSQNPYMFDPTASFVGSAGSTVFSRAAGKAVGGQACDGYKYTNTSQFSTVSGVVYIGHTSNLPCEQDSTVSRKVPNATGTFSQTTITIWSHFNDKALAVPAVPAS